MFHGSSSTVPRFFCPCGEFRQKEYMESMCAVIFWNPLLFTLHVVAVCVVFAETGSKCSP